MITTVALAAIFAAWVKTDRLRWAPYEAHLAAETQWIGSPSSQFLSDSSVSNLPSTRPCFLKISEVGVGSKGWYSTSRLAIAQDGTSCHELMHSLGKKGSQMALPAATLAVVQKIVAALPPSNATSSRGEFVLVGFVSGGSWTTRVYDKTELSPDVLGMLKILHFILL
jgi:hypothetical protein